MGSQPGTPVPAKQVSSLWTPPLISGHQGPAPSPGTNILAELGLEPLVFSTKYRLWCGEAGSNGLRS